MELLPESDLLVKLDRCKNPALSGQNDPTVDLQPIWQVDQLDSLNTDQIASLCLGLARTGYLFVQMSQNAQSTHETSRVELQKFFSRPLAEKMEFHSSRNPRDFGYNNIKTLGKEHLKLRFNGMPWPEEAKMVLRNARGECELLQGIGQKLAKILMRYLGMPEDQLSEMFQEDERPEDRSISSFGESFLYHSNVSDHCVEPCSTHQDVGMLTIIPRAAGAAALEVVNWESKSMSGFHNVELSSQMVQHDGVCVIFPGNLLAAMSAQFFPATPHRVVVRKKQFPRTTAR